MEDFRAITRLSRRCDQGTRNDARERKEATCRSRWSKVVSVLMFLPFLAFLTLFSDVEWVFADDERESNPTTFKFMAMAHAWKMNQAKNNGDGGGTAGLLSGFTATKASVDKAADSDANSDVASSLGDDGPV
jgi:hypothetical protein